MKVRKALALLQSFANWLPKGDIAERYIVLYHKALNDIQTERKEDLSYFHIPEEELEYKTVVYKHSSGKVLTYDGERFCARERFLISFHAAINFINSLTLNHGASTLRLIERD